jgi:putative PIN family toxin of toxin-antitoxin system
MNIMVDTNIIVSAILFPQSIISEIMKHIIKNNRITLCQYIIDEINEVFYKKFPHRIKEMEIFMGKLPYDLFIFNGIYSKKYPEIRDIKDKPVLVNAIESNVNILITGDKDFDKITIKKLKIIKPKIYFYEYIKQTGV